jgi:hypothetical protein
VSRNPTNSNSVQMVEKVTQNARDVWQLTYLTIGNFLVRNGYLAEKSTSLSDYLSIFQHDEGVELSREALYTASVILSLNP